MAGRVIDAGLHPMMHGAPPDWASAWGQDQFGVYAALSVNGVMQRLRWIQPGRFLMGSPENEPGRDDDEGPQHEVTMATGFWLFDTPCTQALWEAVTGYNRSRFKSPMRPVESVSFEDVRFFMQLLNKKTEDLNLVLPSEAQWEYACRAGTTTSSYRGAVDVLGANNAPALDAIAWYGGNSGVDFDLIEGEDSSRWIETQYVHATAGTRLVAQKTPNAWGLYDMLGNVWEFCADIWHDNYDGALQDGSARIDPQGTSDRVNRGGSWYDEARSVRAASRDGARPFNSYGNLGFRCARIHTEGSGRRASLRERMPDANQPGERSEY